METWKPVKGYPDYEVSDLGRVRSKDFVRHIKQANREYDFHRKGKIVKPLKRRHGYLSVFLYYEGGRTQESVHRLVAEAFCEHPEGKDEVNHKNEIKSDNRACNLEWVSHQENCNYGTLAERKSIAHTNGKNSKAVQQYDFEGNLIAEYPSIAEAERQTGFNRSSICCHIKGKPGYSHAYGYKWKYKDTVS